jgi:hypothetical protein
MSQSHPRAFCAAQNPARWLRSGMPSQIRATLQIANGFVAHGPELVECLVLGGRG